MAFYVKATGSALPAWKESLVLLPGPNARFERVRCLKACHLDDPPRGPLLQPPHTFSLTVRPIFRSIRQVD
jgi:hypothetical protein